MTECRDRSGDWSDFEEDFADWFDDELPDEPRDLQAVVRARQTPVGVESEASDDAPPPAAIARTRKLPVNPSTEARGKRASEKVLKGMSNAVRLTEFPGEFLERQEGRLLCGVCRIYLSEKKQRSLAYQNQKTRTG